MNVVFYFIVLLVIIFLWFVLSFLFKPLGGFLYRLWADAKEEMADIEVSKDTEDEEK